MHWFRFYHKWAHDLRLRRLPPAMRWCWVMVLIMASESPYRGWLLLAKDVPVSAEDLAYLAGIPPKDVKAALASFLELRLLESIDGILHVIGWEESQYESDSSTERSRKCRQKAKAATLHETFAVTDMQPQATSRQRCGNGPDTETDSETETETDTITSTCTGGCIPDAGTKAEAPVVSVFPVFLNSVRPLVHSP